MLWTLRALTSEFRIGLDEWDLVLPLVEMSINHRERGVLGDRSAIEVMTGRKPVSTTNLAVWAGVQLKDARKFETKSSLVERHCARLGVALSRLHEKVRDKEETRQRQKALRAARRHPGQTFHQGDYVQRQTIRQTLRGRIKSSSTGKGRMKSWEVADRPRIPFDYWETRKTMRSTGENYVGWQVRNSSQTRKSSPRPPTL